MSGLLEGLACQLLEHKSDLEGGLELMGAAKVYLSGVKFEL